MDDSEVSIPIAGDVRHTAVYFHVKNQKLVGYSIWLNGKLDVLGSDVRWLAGRVALLECEKFTNTISNPFVLLVGNDAGKAVLHAEISELAVSIIGMYGAQIMSGASALPSDEELAKEYCSGRLAGNAFYLFARHEECKRFLTKHGKKAKRLG